MALNNTRWQCFLQLCRICWKIPTVIWGSRRQESPIHFPVVSIVYYILSHKNIFNFSTYKHRKLVHLQIFNRPNSYKKREHCDRAIHKTFYYYKDCMYCMYACINVCMYLRIYTHLSALVNSKYRSQTLALFKQFTCEFEPMETLTRYTFWMLLRFRHWLGDHDWSNLDQPMGNTERPQQLTSVHDFSNYNSIYITDCFS